ncbi:MATH domain-containing protein [Caenorhabditis elegans]|uniref:MATH domain-containing protein n=1 Tax=Caenorhabditis elegans TaxID=6239 RepID=Q9N586_CAEEL|nr:MATH domain-containing protein [Caenorhabditis elegans]CCD66191.1 MATH domain-containing protein [Caenorhabditis elegans]|eukprot:NP_491534.2 TNF Receptor Associated Factor (TRAF) homolog [Caenorhabditis elegans]
METPIMQEGVEKEITPRPIMVQPMGGMKPIKSASNPPTPLDSPFMAGAINRPRTSTRSVGVSIPIHVEGEEPTAPKSIVPDNWIDCPFKEHGCHKKGENSEVKRHVRDDRNLHLVLLCQSLNPIRTKINIQQSAYVDKYVGMLQYMSIAESAFEKYGSQHTFRIPKIGLTVVKATKNKSHRSIYSQPFYSHGYGYKMMAVAAPYGDGLAFREYFSVFVCLMKGEWDDILEWPFRCDVTFSILSDDKKELLTKTIYVNEMPEIQEFLERPEGLRNGTFGFQNFLPLAKVTEFAADGDIFIQIKVLLSKEKQKTQAKEVDSSECQSEMVGSSKAKSE